MSKKLKTLAGEQISIQSDQVLYDNNTTIKQSLDTEKGRINNLVTGAVSTTKFITIKSDALSSGSSLSFLFTSKTNNDIKEIKDKTPNVIEVNIYGQKTNGSDVTDTCIPSSYVETKSNDEYKINVYSNSEMTSGYSYYAIITISYLEEVIDNAEIKDARTGTDGTVYDNLGTAIRTQVSSLEEDLNTYKLDAEYTLEEIENLEIQNGLINHNTGTIDLTENGYLMKKYTVDENILCITGISFNYNNDYSAVTFFDEYNSIIGFYPKDLLDEANKYTRKEIIKIPKKCKYIVVNGNKNNCNIYKLKFKSLNSSIDDFLYNSYEHKKIFVESVEIENKIGLYDPRTYKTQDLTISGYRKAEVEVKEGEVYFINSVQILDSEQFPAYSFIDENKNFVGLGTFPKDTVLVNEMITVPHNAKYMLLNTKTSLLRKISVFRFNKNASFNNVNTLTELQYTLNKLTELESNSFFSDFSQMADLVKRIKDGGKTFSYNEFDSGYATIIFDDGRHDLSLVASICKEFNVPLCCAIPTDTLNNIADNGKTIKEVCKDVVNNGGEILSHSVNGNVVTDVNKNDMLFLKDMLMTSKEILTNNGFIIRGFIKPGGADAIDWKSNNLQKYTQLFYDYADACGEDPQYYRVRRALGYDDINVVKNWVDDAITNKKWLTFMSHTLDGTEKQLTEEWFREFLIYATQKGLKFKTYSYMYDTFGTWI